MKPEFRKTTSKEAFKIYLLPLMLLLIGCPLSLYIFYKDITVCNQSVSVPMASPEETCYWNSMIYIPLLWLLIFASIAKARGDWGKHSDKYTKDIYPDDEWRD